MIRVLTETAEETRRLGAAVAELARPADLLLLSGDLGAGKTTFSQGFGAGLGVDESITSPTFTIVRSYRGRLPLHHLDVYRLEQPEEVADLGLGELLDDDAVTLVEWGEHIAPLLGSTDHLEVRIHLTEVDDERAFTFEPVGTSWLARSRALRSVLAPWGGGSC